MANPEHLEVLERGTQAWNMWRKDNPSIKPDFRWANLFGISTLRSYAVEMSE
jgi:hypothetical protein